MIKKIRDLKFIIHNMEKGMTYTELIVVLSIFSIMTSIVMFNYKSFQDKVDIKVLANDIALKIVEAQKSALSGKLPVQFFDSSWSPSYGIYFNTAGTVQSADSKHFIYFTNTQNSSFYNFDDISCSLPPTVGGSGECLDWIEIKKGNSISRLDIFYQDGTSTVAPAIPPNDLTITFTRPNSGPTLKSTAPFTSTVSYVQITVSSTSGITARIKIYASGRIQIN